MELSSDDFTVLLEALDAWEAKDTAGRIMSGVIGSLLIKDEADKAQWKADEEKAERKAEQERAVRKERAILLNAKLLQMRDAALVTAVERSLA